MTAVHRYGDKGPPVILVHGWCCNAAFWREQIDVLSQCSRVAALDLGCPDPGGTDWSIALAGAAVAHLAERIAGADRVAIVGHSMGGPIALEAAIRLGEHCRLVVGVDTFTDAVFYRGLHPAAIEMRLAPFRGDFPRAVRMMVDRITLTGGEELRRWIGDAMAAVEPEQALARLRALLEWDIEAVWPAMRCPVATINSRPLSLSAARIELPGLLEEFVDDTGHFPMLEARQPFNAKLLEALCK